MGSESLILRNAGKPEDVIHALQDAVKPHKHEEHTEDREPFDILVDTLSDVVKWHLVTGWKQYITRDYVEKLDETLSRGIPIDLRTSTEKIVIENWKEKYVKKDDNAHGEHSDHDGHHH